ncbi:NAD(P)-binding protein [Patellaria atrata CBS 101060]|uniref:NAD(P)-binding protein n=1 Tax=Patellaria atrata CBS 101060 TaxID=1346257 RepID=A0A9P4S407_9PEZI|nr:NAD(P)-binding protein [Patellaria atrata CBS 101060]
MVAAKNQMSQPSNNDVLVITGINGYIASVLGYALLKKGYHIRGTVRSLEKAKPLLEGVYAPYKDRVQIYQVPDITADGAFDEVVKGAHGIFHIASPVGMSLKTYDEAIKPAIRGSTGILSSTLAHAGPQLRAVVVTSSIASLFSGRPGPGEIITEASRPNLDLLTLRVRLEAGEIKAPVYALSKIAADVAVWKWYETKKPPFSLCSIHPSLVIGPPVTIPCSGDALCETLHPLWEIFSGKSLTRLPTLGSGLYVDIRDVVDMHCFGYEHPEVVDGHRFIASGGFGPAQAIADILHAAYPMREGKMPKGKPGEGYIGFQDGKVGKVQPIEGAVTISSKKAEKMMGINWVDFRDSVRDTAKALEVLL